MVFSRSEIRLEVLRPRPRSGSNGDRVRLAQVIGNLLQNAAKFTPHGGKTTVSVESDAATGPSHPHRARHGQRDRARDAAAALPALHPGGCHPRPQARAASGSGSRSSRGSSRCTAVRCSAASDGRGKGATSRSPSRSIAAARRRARARRRLGVSCAHRAACSSSRTTRTRRIPCARPSTLDGHAVEVAYSGREGIEKAQAFHPDVVLCDIGLPEMDGYEVARTMRADPELGTRRARRLERLRGARRRGEGQGGRLRRPSRQARDLGCGGADASTVFLSPSLPAGFG